MANETTAQAKQNGMPVGTLLGSLREERAVISEALDVDRHGLTLTLRVRVGVEDLDPAHTTLFFGFILDKLMTAYGEIERLRGERKEHL